MDVLAVAGVLGDDAAGADGVPDGLGEALGAGAAGWVGVAVGAGAPLGWACVVLAGTSYW